MFENLSEKSVAETQEEQVNHWKDIDLLDRCVKEREDCPSFVFFEGPPTANGKPGIHHVMARTLKDSINRYKTMKGFQVKRKAGWDTHGLQVEIEVEKQLGMNGKQDIEKYGIKEFNEKCRVRIVTLDVCRYSASVDTSVLPCSVIYSSNAVCRSFDVKMHTSFKLCDFYSCYIITENNISQ